MGNSNYTRYSAHINLEEIGVEGQRKIQNASVLVVGAGGLGCPSLQYLSAAGVGKIGVIDYDSVNQSNLPRQILFNKLHLGQNKAVVACEVLSNNDSKLTAYAFALTKHNAIDLFKQYELILDCTDNLTTRYLISDAALITGRPVVFAGVHKYEGQLSVFNYKNGPSYRCLFPTKPENEECRNCSETGILSTVPGIAGIYQANEALKIIIGLENVLSGKLLVFNMKDLNSRIVNFKRNDNAMELANKTFGVISEKV